MLNFSFHHKPDFVDRERFEKYYIIENLNRIFWSTLAFLKLILNNDVEVGFSLALVIALLHLGFSIAISIWQHGRKVFFYSFPLPVTIADLGYLTYVIFFTGLDNSYMYLFYFFPISFWGLRYGLKGSLTISSLIGLLYYGVNYINLDSVPPEIFLRILFFIYFSIYMGLLCEKTQNRMYNMATQDGLTSLYNQKYFYEVLSYSLNNAEKSNKAVSIALLDLDNFKNYNDSLGHLKGDQLLRDVSLLIKNSIRTSDTAARYGGDEFVIIFPDTDLKAAMMVSERIRNRIKEDIITPKNLPLSVSIGVATYPEDGLTARDLFDAADQSLYSAKKRGKNRVINEPDAMETSL